MKRPNFLVIFPDQQRFDHVGCYGLGGDTPHVDRIAAGGCRFDRAYTPCPLCSPARAAMLTGRFGHANGVPTNTSDRVPGPARGEVLVSQHLTQAGYRCGYSGKWHVSKGPIEPWGFADVAGNHNHYAAWCRREGVPPMPDLTGTPQRFQLTDAAGRVGEYSTPVPARAPCGQGQDYDTFVAAEALRLMGTYAGGDAPWAVWCCFHGPHPPFVIPEPYLSLYSSRAVPQPANFVEPPPADSWHAASCPINTHCLGWPWSRWQESAAAYRGYVKLLDDAVGLLLDGLEGLGLSNNTVVVYATDHGEMLGNHRLWQKLNFYEESARIPMIVRPPGAAAARATNQFASLLDLTPTMLDYAGIERPGNLHGRSLRRVIEGERGDGPEAVFSEINPDGLRPANLRMVRTDRHKYIWYREGRHALYDVREDPHELNDRIDDPSCRAIVRQHRRLLADWMRRTADPMAASLDAG